MSPKFSDLKFESTLCDLNQAILKLDNGLVISVVTIDFRFYEIWVMNLPDSLPLPGLTSFEVTIELYYFSTLEFVGR